ncbi:hypothetical protein AVEN_261810-1 [Araneus ventricosus]|uniref:Xrn1 N-terminal domain-containing protein n=1 Tax=Araneus ventricosus TaxID=182803 RepID=A0A4Y2LY39_ARAVE|nr:hypothetical protein AVEN_261810-1 [Araneus ventricosus]
MGITNFCKLMNKLIEPDEEPPTEPHSFDSILYDAQSLLHVAISEALETDESKLFRELCRSAWHTLEKQLDVFLDHATAESITLVLSFDGAGVPMKWPTQRERRSKKDGERQRSVRIQGKMKYRSALFGPNVITMKIQKYFVQRLKRYRFQKAKEWVVVVSGCNMPGEGEHKLFQIAESLQSSQRVRCRNPLIVSQDQDVFVLALMRLSRYETLQIFRYGRYYPVTKLIREWLPYPVERLETCSFLFGNDFIPAVVGITLQNVCAIHQCLTLEENPSPPSSYSSEDAGSDSELDDESVPDTHPVSIMARFVERMNKHLRFHVLAHLDGTLVEAFWLVYFWLGDYYTRSEFPQKYMDNPIYDAFDRNQLLTALTSLPFSLRCYERARDKYENVTRDPATAEEAEKAVFMEEDVVATLKSYWVKPDDKACVVLKLRNRSSPSYSAINL